MIVAALPDLEQLDIEALKMLVIEEREQRLEAHIGKRLPRSTWNLIRARNRSNT